MPEGNQDTWTVGEFQILLRKYMSVIIHEEGIDYINHILTRIDDNLTRKEMAMLQKVSYAASHFTF